MSTFISTAIDETTKLFLRNMKNVLAQLTNSTQDVLERIAAFMALDLASQERLRALANPALLEQPSEYARNLARDEFTRALYHEWARAFLAVQRNFVFEFATKPTEASIFELEDLEIAAGERAPQPAAVPPPPPPTPQEILDAQVIEDWALLPVDKMRKKLQNPAYKAAFDRLEAENKLRSQVTSLHDAGSEVR